MGGKRNGRREVNQTGRMYLQASGDGTVRRLSEADGAAIEAAAAPPAPAVVAADEPCYGCPCCGAWTKSLELLRAAITNHEFVRTVAGTCETDCLVCGSIERTW